MVYWFDGDEMNIFLSQSLQTQIELEEIADVKRQIITPSTSRTVIGIVQDGLLGAYNLTTPTMRIDWRNAMNIMSYTSIDDFATFKKDKEYTGHEMYTMIIPPNINVDKGGVKIKNGVFESGKLTDEFLGAFKKNNLIQLVWDEYGPEETKQFIDNTQRLINNFNLYNGFTVGYGDIDIKEDVTKKINDMIATKEQKVNHMITEIENNPDLMERNVFEFQMFSELNIIRDDVSKLIMENLKPDNNCKIMISSGSKGGPTNMGQMSGCVGLQAFEGKLIPMKYNRRTLPYFHENDDRAVSRGLVKQSFTRGMEFPEFVYHMLTGREGIIDQAIKSVSGDTSILIQEDGKMKRVLIGDWIDNHMENNKESIKRHKEYDQELLNLTNKVYIPTTDNKGNVSWEKITAITRHDPTKSIYEIKTHGGRSVIVADSKSLLIWNEAKQEFEGKLTVDVKIGDLVPVTWNLSKEIENNDMTMCEYQINDNGQFKKQNDVILDRIISIQKVDVTKYKKLYDVTVPKTLNFMIANGLNLADTAETGYQQRKLIKSMEDIMVKYDNTIRTANDSLLQLTYGDSGADATRQYEYVIKMLKMGDKELSSKHQFTSEELKNLKKFTKKDNDDMYGLIRVLRDELRMRLMRCKEDFKVLTNNFMLPVNLNRIIDSNMGKKELVGGEKLQPEYIVAKLVDLLSNERTSLMCLTSDEKKLKNSIKRRDEEDFKFLFKVSLFDALSPKRCIVEYNLSQKQFDAIINEIIENYNKNLVEAGEMVGIICAQSMGECLTQMSTLASSRVMIADKNGTINYISIGEFSDRLLEKNDKYVRKVPNYKDSVVLDMTDDYYIVSVDQKERLHWKKISQISRHPANGNLMRVTTKSGRTTTATLSHSFLKRTSDGIDPIKGSELKVGDRIPVAKNIKPFSESIKTIKVGDKTYRLDYDLGWLFGAYLADGSINQNIISICKIIPEFCDNISYIVNDKFKLNTKTSNDCGEYGPSKDTYFSYKELAKFIKENFGVGSYEKKLPSFVFNANKLFMAGIISGYFDGDGNIDVNKSMIRVSSRSKQLINDIAMLCSFFNMFGSILEERSVRQVGKVQYNFCIQRKYAQIFNDQIGLIVNEKRNNLQKLMIQNERDKHCLNNFIDMIPCLGDDIVQIAKLLKLNNKKNHYRGWAKRNAIGRETLGKFIEIFNNTDDSFLDDETQKELHRRIAKLESAYDSDIIWDEIIDIEILLDPKEYVYDFTVPSTESFMIDTGILVHNTLNSLDWNEKIIISYDEKEETLEIGKYIDDLMMYNHNVKNLGTNRDQEMGDTSYLETKQRNMKIQSVNEDGKITWNLIEAITKHLPINKDGTNTLLHIKTKQGFEVTGTKAKSFLTRKDNKIVPIRGDELKIGTYMPIMRNKVGDINNEIIPSVKLQHWEGDIEKSKLHNMLEYNLYDSDKKIIQNTLNSDVYYDQIVLIEEVQPSHKYVYDLTVADTKTFCIQNGLCCMDSFHSSGIKSMSSTTQGVPRIKEIMSVSKNPKTPQMMIYLTDEFKTNKEMAQKIASHIKYTTLGDIRGRVNIYYNTNPREKGGHMETDNVKEVFYNHKATKTSCQADINSLPWLMRIELDREKMLEKEVTMLEIKSKFCSWWERRFTEAKTMRKEEKKVINKITSLAILSNTDNDKHPVIHIRFNVKDADKIRDPFDTDTLNNFIDYIVDKFKLKGINSISNFTLNEERMITFNNEDHDIENKTEYVIYTSGVNLLDIRYIMGIDPYRTIANDIVETYKTFGIEIARARLMREIFTAYERAGKSVNYQHLSILAEIMTYNGYIMSIDRHGMNKSDNDPLSRASFEKTVEQLLIAAVFGERDHMKGISSRIMAGLVIKGGTGYCDIVLDTEMIEKSEYVEENAYIKTFNEITSSNIASDIINKEGGEIFIPV